MNVGHGNSRCAHWVFVIIFIWLSFNQACAAGEAPVEAKRGLEGVILAPDFWELNPDAFARKVSGLQFYWVSKDKASARSQARFLTFQNQSVVEVIVRFSSNTVSEVMLSFFNRGDMGEISEDDFRKKVVAVTNMIGEISGVTGKDVTRREDTVSERKAQTMVWIASNTEFRLESASSRVKDRATNSRLILPEFANLFIRANTGQIFVGASPEGKAQAGFIALRQKIKRTPTGDVYLDQVPMVDQGQKGYCAVATAERVMRYYGLDMNQHEIAQKAHTSTRGAMGTDSKSLLTALKAIANSADLQLKVVDKFDADDFKKQIQHYNREAKRNRVAEIGLPQSGVIDVVKIYGQMDKRIYLQSRAKGGNTQMRFFGNIQDKINSGYPVFWGVTLGFVEETIKLPQKIGGHMRLIIGYNDKSKEIIYTDSWGPGHEMKRMSQQDAFTITTCLYSMEP
ncbi:MAG: C39 family peptidase [Verrucomicrobia bacterium]|nr:C39 family peptidase [Verrucomicrobiota bacterium]MCG2681967.1 C39 family peptidase [Kiritimatiellia bacterium]MBU4248443.1 C39 family peptidase [Verrucomicrobiota bacterium]MBU4292345.1 C39 family peptidase [Verrucomicrobiota bacterium]MBU4430026.1 C39 family peptidase [Verrucomicrobiota bacterium]